MKAKRPAGMTSKRNPQDITLRNNRAQRSAVLALKARQEGDHDRIKELESRTAELKQQLDVQNDHMHALEGRVYKIENPIRTG